MSRKRLSLSKLVLSFHSVGFIAIIVFSWLNESEKLPGLSLHASPYVADSQECIREMLLVLVVWVLSSIATRRLLGRVEYLEQFMKVCAWCHQVDYRGEWVPMETFLRRGFDTPTSHGICPACLKREKAAIERAREKRTALGEPGLT